MNARKKVDVSAWAVHYTPSISAIQDISLRPANIEASDAAAVDRAIMEFGSTDARREVLRVA